MKKKNYMTKVTMIDILVVLMLLVAGSTAPVFQDIIRTIKPYDILIYGVLCINMLVDLLLLILNKFKKAGNILQNMAIFFLILKLLVVFMASLVFIVISLAN